MSDKKEMTERCMLLLKRGLVKILMHLNTSGGNWTIQIMNDKYVFWNVVPHDPHLCFHIGKNKWHITYKELPRIEKVFSS